MRYYQYKPPSPLSAYVRCLWYSEGFEGTHARERLLPSGESTIVFDLREPGPGKSAPGERDGKAADAGDDAGDAGDVDLSSPAVFCGARTDCFVIETSAQERVIGIQFKPGGAFPFLTMPASAVAGATHDLNDAWGPEATLLREQLLEASGVRAMFAILERTLLGRLRRESALDPAVMYAAGLLSSGRGEVKVADVTGQIGMSARRFGDLFREQTGLTPKAFHRVRRFQRVLRTLRGSADGSWAEVALHCGYYDQAHFIHDFRHFSGLTPGEYLRVVTPHLNHLPLK
jgi:AraC-like DNA-binding protein